jgi:hypothetical protein
MRKPKPHPGWVAGIFCPWTDVQVVLDKWRANLRTEKGLGLGYLPVFSTKRAARKAFPKAPLIRLVKTKENP